ncbi:hypothetical protein SAY87_026429 [Trapa incisa]|uniref:protein-serine/threonine phosphatase n=1 Tax=Trapa incisa TaxID=236973 RepID=A0AAN7GZK6_9MYRT|nr:hypothetical protein SAY87_026429 [Trapa incisa]
MVAEAEVEPPSRIPMLEVQHYSSARASAHVRELMTVSSPVPAPNSEAIQVPESVYVEVSTTHHAEVRAAEVLTMEVPESPSQDFVPSIRSGSFAAIGARRNMEDEHLRIDDLSKHLGPPFQFPQPCAFYGVFDGHGGPEAAAFIKGNIMKLLFDEAEFPSSTEVDKIFTAEVTNSIEKAYLLADNALAAGAHEVVRSTGTTALTAFIFGSHLMVANAGDCRAVLCRKGMAINMSQDHKPTNPLERRRVEQLGAFVEDGYLNGLLSVTRALGDWDIKSLAKDIASSPLIPNPEVMQLVLTEEDEFLILACDGIWDVMSSQLAVNIVRRGLRKHDNPKQCARDLVKESLRLGAHDNLTVVVVCLLGPEHRTISPSTPDRHRKLRFFSLSSEALCSFKGFLDGGGSR